MHILRAITLMILSMVLLALSDMFIKLAAADLPVGQVMLLVSTGGTLLFILFALVQRAPVLSRQAWHRWVLLRNLFEITGAIGIVLGIALIPLSLFAAIMQMTPLVVTLGAAVFLREPVGWRRWSAIFAGIVGVMLVIRPGLDGFDPASLLAVMGVVSLGLRDLVTRLAPRELPAISLACWGFFSTIPAGILMLTLRDETPVVHALGLWNAAGAVVVTAAGYYLVTLAMRMAPAAIVSPFRYSRLVFTMGLGVVIFGERPDGLTLAGTSLIILAGLYSLLRERRLAREMIVLSTPPGEARRR